MGEQARVTVVIPAYKAEKTIRRAVDSVLAQEGVDARVVVVVDGVFDRTLEMLEGYDPARVKVLVNERNLKVQATRNRGLAACEDEFVMFLDCDDYVEGPLLAGLAGRMRADDSQIAFGPVQRVREPAGTRSAVVERAYASPDDLFWQWIGLGLGVSTSAMLWRAAFLREIGGWDERVFRNEDGEVAVRTVMRGGRFSHSSEGRGLYVNDDSADRLTRRPEILESAIDVGEILAAAPAGTVDEEVRRKTLALYFYRVALRLTAFGRPDLARRARRRAREMGGKWPRWPRALFALIGLPFRLGLLRLDRGARPVRLYLGASARLQNGVTRRLGRA